jgi:AraC family transcriptional regulator of adaptative response/methylated-DNA-[protein]-cysteine methyltransferase
MTAQQDQYNFSRMAKAIVFIQTHALANPSLAEIAEHVHMSPTHFQRVFTTWAGTSPKQLLQFIRLQEAKKMLLHHSVQETVSQLSFSSPSRLHDLFVHMEAMTPAAYRDGGSALQISFECHDSVFGMFCIGSTDKGICHLQFCENQEQGYLQLKTQFPNAHFIEKSSVFHRIGVEALQGKSIAEQPLTLHVKGSPFQIKVWEGLLRIPEGRLTSYGQLATQIEAPKASRAVGTAIGSNPVAYLIPCHRVIRASGILGGYRWGETRKTAMIFKEWAQHLS